MLYLAAVSCSPVPYRLAGVGFGFLVDKQAGLCIGRCMGGAWHDAWHGA